MEKSGLQTEIRRDDMSNREKFANVRVGDDVGKACVL